MPNPATSGSKVEIPQKDHYTYADYRQLPEGAPYELIQGQLVMSPSPTVRHQLVVLALAADLREYVASQTEGSVLVAPMDVFLSSDTVVQPDVLYVSHDRRDRIGTDEIRGAPDLVMEVVSSSSGHRDLLEKKRLYEESGVREYWIVDPNSESIEIHISSENAFGLHERRVETGTAASALLDGFSVDLPSLFS